MTSIPNYFLRYCKDIANLLPWVIWECLIMPIIENSNLVGNFDDQTVEINFKETLMSICMQKINFIFNFFKRYCQDIANLLFWELWECLTISIKIALAICSKLSCLSTCKKSTLSPNSFLTYWKEIANGHAWPHTPKLIITIWRNDRRLPVGKRLTSSFTFSLRYYKDIIKLLFWVL